MAGDNGMTPQPRESLQIACPETDNRPVWSRRIVCGMSLVMIGMLGVGDASAGQLHIEHYGLKEVRRSEDTVLVGKVLATQKQKKSMQVSLEVTRVFAPATTAAEPMPQGLGGNGKPIKVGDRISREVYGGVEWTDPHKSPLDRRLRGGLRGLPADGATIVLVPASQGAVEILPFDEARLRTLTILYSADPAIVMRAASQSALEDDLKNEDLAELARAELKSRGKLSPVLLLKGDENELYELYRTWAPVERAKFLREAMPTLVRDVTLRRRAAKVALNELTPEVIAPTAELVSLLDWKSPDDRRALEDARIALLGVVNPDQKRNTNLDLSSYGDYLYESTVRRPDYRNNDEDLDKLLAYCDTPTKAKLAARLLGAVYSSDRARGDDFDAFVLAAAVDLAKVAPSVALWEPLQKLQPQKPRVTSQKETVLRAMVEIGSALAKHDTQYKSKVRELIEPLLTTDVNLPDEIMKSYRDHVGAVPRGKPVAVTLELGPKQWRRLASGERVSIHKQTSGDYEVEVTHADGSSTAYTLQAKTDWYREWWIEPYVIVVNRIGDRIRLRMTPAEKDPALEPATLYEMAKKICERRGGTGEVLQDPDDALGVYTYEIKGAKACKVRLGMRTKTLRP